MAMNFSNPSTPMIFARYSCAIPPVASFSSRRYFPKRVGWKFDMVPFFFTV